MWLKSKGFIKPFFPGKKNNQPYHNLQFKSLPKILVQNASLEISKVKVLNLYKSITGKKNNSILILKTKKVLILITDMI